MKTFYSALLCALITTVSIAQINHKAQDTTTQKVTTLDEVIVTGN